MTEERCHNSFVIRSVIPFNLHKITFNIDTEKMEKWCVLAAFFSSMKSLSRSCPVMWVFFDSDQLRLIAFKWTLTFPNNETLIPGFFPPADTDRKRERETAEAFS